MAQKRYSPRLYAGMVADPALTEAEVVRVQKVARDLGTGVDRAVGCEEIEAICRAHRRDRAMEKHRPNRAAVKRELAGIEEHASKLREAISRGSLTLEASARIEDVDDYPRTPDASWDARWPRMRTDLLRLGSRAHIAREVLEEEGASGGASTDLALYALTEAAAKLWKKSGNRLTQGTGRKRNSPPMPSRWESFNADVLKIASAKARRDSGINAARALAARERNNAKAKPRPK